jgi:hypothetical protein
MKIHRGNFRQIVSRFLWWPTTLPLTEPTRDRKPDRETRWLCHAYIVQELKGGGIDTEWVDVCWTTPGMYAEFIQANPPCQHRLRVGPFAAPMPA